MTDYGKQVANKMTSYMNDPNSIDKEVKDIQDAVVGVEVRGALAAGVKKSFDKSKAAEETAGEAHDVMESIMEEGFDNAALEANFEQKLDDKINNLQPEWTQFKENTETQLAETESMIADSSSVLSDLIYKKKVAHSLPLRFPDYYEVNEGAILSPQQLFVSNELGKIFIQYTNKEKKSNVIVLYNLNGVYDRCFIVDQYGYESIAVDKINDEVTLYLGDNETPGGLVHKYNISSLPNNKSTIAPYDSIELGYNYNFGFNPIDREFLLQYRSLDFLDITDDNFRVKKTVKTKDDFSWLIKRPEEAPLPQSFTLNNNFIFWGLGRITSDYGERDQQGLIVLDRSGKIVNVGMLDAKKMKKILENEGFLVDSLENEGCSIGDDGKLYTITTTLTRKINTADAEEEGIIIFEEFSLDSNALDFKKAKTPLLSFDRDIYSNRFFPDSTPSKINGYFYHPVTKVKLESIADFCEFMCEYQIPFLNIYKYQNDILKNAVNEQVNTAIYFKLINLNNNRVIGHEYGDLFTNTFSYLDSNKTLYYHDNGKRRKRLTNRVNLNVNEQKGFSEDAYKKIIIRLQYNGEIEDFELDYPNTSISKNLNMLDFNKVTLSFSALVVRVRCTRESINIAQVREIIMDNGEYSRNTSPNNAHIVFVEAQY